MPIERHYLRMLQFFGAVLSDEFLGPLIVIINRQQELCWPPTLLETSSGHRE